MWKSINENIPKLALPMIYHRLSVRACVYLWHGHDHALIISRHLGGPKCFCHAAAMRMCRKVGEAITAVNRFKLIKSVWKINLLTDSSGEGIGRGAGQKKTCCASTHWKCYCVLSNINSQHLPGKGNRMRQGKWLVYIFNLIIYILIKKYLVEGSDGSTLPNQLAVVVCVCAVNFDIFNVVHHRKNYLQRTK